MTGIDYKRTLENALKELSKHPDFAHINEITTKQGAVNAAHQIGKIVSASAVLRESKKATTVDNNDQTYKAILQSLLKALAGHPDFTEIGTMAYDRMLANAAGRVKEILGNQEALRESMDSEEFDPATGMWLGKPGKFNNEHFIIPRGPIAEANTDDLFILIPGGTEQVDEAAKNDNAWFDFPESSGSDDDDFYVETFGL